MKNLFYCLGLLSIFLLNSCADTRKPGQLDEIDGMLNKVDSLEVNLIEHRLDSAVHYASQTEMVERRIKTYYFTDTVNMAFARKMDAFKVMRRKFMPLSKEYDELLEALTQEKEKLQELRRDIEDGKNARDKYDEFIAFEQAKVQQLTLLVEAYAINTKETISSYNELYEELNNFSLGLMEKAKARQQ